VAALGLAACAGASPLAWVGAAVMLLLSVSVAATQALQARLAPQHDGWQSRLLVAWLCYVQPLVRSWSRYRTRLFAYRAPRAHPTLTARQHCLPLKGKKTISYWNAGGVERLQLLGCVILYLNEHHWGKTLDSGWNDWDLEIYCHPWTVVQVSTAEENHGDNKFLIRVRFRLRPSNYWNLLAGLGVVALTTACVLSLWPAAALAGVCFSACAGLWWLGTRRAAEALAVFERWADEFGLIRLQPTKEVAAATISSPGTPVGVRSRVLGWLRWRRRNSASGRTPLHPALENFDAEPSLTFDLSTMNAPLSPPLEAAPVNLSELQPAERPR
jgi:hypothetical protein